MNLRWRLSHAKGYLELGLLDEAAEEFSHLSLQECETTEILSVHALILQEQHKWPELRVAAAKLVEREPTNVAWWLAWAYASRRAESLVTANRILLNAEALHPDDPTVQFNLGCYACQLGDLPDARQRIARAIAIDSRFRQTAENDPDLVPLHSAGL